MEATGAGKIWTAAGVGLVLWLGVRYLLPVLLPFLLGAAVALAAEPLVRLLTKRVGLGRGAAAGVGVSVTLILLLGMLGLGAALTVRQLGQLAGALPDMEQTVHRGWALLEDTLVSAADRLPEGIRTATTGAVLSFFSDADALLRQLAARLPRLLSSVLGWIPDGALGIGTGILAGFMISARLPRLRTWLHKRLPGVWHSRYLPVLGQLRRSLGGWLKAQGKLTLITYGLLSAGFLLLGVRQGLLWALPVALIDAIPILGTGAVLVPWALICFLQGSAVRGMGLLGLWVAAVIVRRVLEPKLVGQQLGLDPLLTLLFFYGGYCFWGIGGMIAAPLLAAAVKTVVLCRGE